MDKTDTKRLLAAVAGTVLEWAEYTTYGYLAPTMAMLFFPAHDRAAGLMATFGIFAAGFLMRPLGGWWFGHLGDRVGRKPALVLSIVLMGVATLAMALLPTYTQIGLWAPLLLLLCRLLQGLAVAGELNGAAVFLIEHAPKDRAHSASSWCGAASAAGMVLGSFMALAVSLPEAPVWAWRLPFMLGFVGCGVAWYLRRFTEETPAFLQLAQEKKLAPQPAIALFKDHKKAMVHVFILAAFVAVWVYLCNLYYKTFLVEVGGLTVTTAGLLVLLGQGLVVVAYPFMGRLADRVGGITLIRCGLWCALLVAPLIFIAGTSGNVGFIIIGQVLYVAVNALVGAPVFKYLFDLFPTAVRFSGQALAWSVSASLIGGTAPLLAQYWVGTLGFIAFPAVYMNGITLLALKFVGYNKRSVCTKIMEH